MVPTGQVDKVLGPHLQRIYKIRWAPPCDPGRTPDAVSVSTQAQRMRVATEAIHALGETREAKIAETRRLLEQGGYQPSEQEIADRMLRRAIEKLV